MTDWHNIATAGESVEHPRNLLVAVHGGVLIAERRGGGRVSEAAHQLCRAGSGGGEGGAGVTQLVNPYGGKVACLTARNRSISGHQTC